MKIYTKTGDKGETGLIGGVRIAKDDLRISTYGTLDELNACLGMVLAQGSQVPPRLGAELLTVQAELFQLGAELATPEGQKAMMAVVQIDDITKYEQSIDAMEATLAPLKNFILPGGNQAGAGLHFARTVCRRAERLVVTLAKSVPIRNEVVVYLNRLSDYLFVAARYTNAQASIEDTPWKPR
jgi:cob(I)alamin adenosyltransferase